MEELLNQKSIFALNLNLVLIFIFIPQLINLLLWHFLILLNIYFKKVISLAIT